MLPEIKDFLIFNEDFAYIENEATFLKRYPSSIAGVPAPSSEPVRYPCLAKEVGYWNNPNGQDEYIMYYIYCD